MPIVPPVPTVSPDLDFYQHALTQGDVAALLTKRLAVLGQLDDYRSQMSSSLAALNAAIGAINDELDAQSITLDLQDGLPPVIPFLRVSSGSATSLTVQWNRPDETNVEAYLSYRRPEGIGEPQLIHTLGPIGDFPSGFNRQTGLEPGTSYEITVLARSFTGVLGPPSVVIGTTATVAGESGETTVIAAGSNREQVQAAFAALVDDIEVGDGDTVDARGLGWITSQSLAYAQTLQARGVTVLYDTLTITPETMTFYSAGTLAAENGIPA